MEVKIGIVGSGNLATHFVKGFQDCGFPVEFIHSRNQRTGRALAKKSKVKFVAELPDATSHPFLLFICTGDSSIQELFRRFDNSGYYLIHSSGMLPLLKSSKTLTGVFYPVQTFSKTQAVNWKEIPICIESRNSKLEKILLQIGRKLSGKTMLLSSEKRAHLHLSAVFANNFVNANYTMAMQLLKAQHIPFSLLEGLISQTARNAIEQNPALVQTGPAKRHDVETIKAHQKLLKGKTKERKVYDLLTEWLLTSR
jgi:predicted short-subunit dehydrogenase-like oxidoreductase (DUF2520 family)